jgi:hypothetical protein
LHTPAATAAKKGQAAKIELLQIPLSGKTPQQLQGQTSIEPASQGRTTEHSTKGHTDSCYLALLPENLPLFTDQLSLSTAKVLLSTDKLSPFPIPKASSPFPIPKASPEKN